MGKSVKHLINACIESRNRWTEDKEIIAVLGVGILDLFIHELFIKYYLLGTVLGTGIESTMNIQTKHWLVLLVVFMSV